MLRAIRLSLYLVISLVSTVGLAQPGNDLCNAAIPLSCGAQVTGSTNTATFDKADFCGTNNTAPGVWYRFAGTGDYITLSTCNSATNFDSKISVFEGSCTALACVNGNDDDNTCTASIRASRVRFQSVVGKTYYILVHGFARATGNFQLDLTCGLPPLPPVNDTCAGALTLNCGASLNGSTVGATVDQGITCGGATTEPGVWYRFTGNGDRFAISVCQADYDTRLSVFSGTCSGLSCIAFNDDGCGLQSRAIIRSDSNQIYYVLVHGANGESGNFTLDLTCESRPANDACANAAPLSCGTPVQGSTEGASLDNTPSCGMPQTAPGVWYSFTGNGDIATLSTCSILSNFDTRISVYAGSCASLSCVAENDDADCLFGNRLSSLSFATTNGETYRVLVHGFAGETGRFLLSLNCAPAPPVPANDLRVNAVTLACGDSLAGTTLGAGPDSIPACGMLVGGPGVWYAFNGTGDEVSLTTCNADTDFDTQLGVFIHKNGQLMCVAGNDDDFSCLANSGSSSLRFFTNQGEVYYILVQGFNGDAGNFALQASCTPVSPVLIESCNLDAFDPGNNLSFMIFLAGTPGLSPDYLPVGNSGRLLRYSDGRAEVTGTVVNRFDLNGKWDLHMQLYDARNWAQWSADSGRFKGSRPEALNNHPDWLYYKLDSSSYISGTPGGAFAGDTLWLKHEPVDYTYGFQLGTGANDRNGWPGMSGWFTFSGAYQGHGDLNCAFTSCQRLVRMSARVQLEGPQDGPTGMRNNLSSEGLLSLQQPFANIFNYRGTESLSTIPANATDWVLVELRDPANPSQVLGSTAAILRNDGQIVNTNGGELLEISLPGLAVWAGHAAYIAIQHPGHMPVMSAKPVSLDQEVSTWDATKSPVVEWDPAVLTKGPRGQYVIPAGDLDKDGSVEATESSLINSQMFNRGHFRQDLNADGEVNATDMRMLFKNAGKQTTFPR